MAAPVRNGPQGIHTPRRIDPYDGFPLVINQVRESSPKTVVLAYHARLLAAPPNLPCCPMLPAIDLLTLRHVNACSGGGSIDGGEMRREGVEQGLKDSELLARHHHQTSQGGVCHEEQHRRLWHGDGAESQKHDGVVVETQLDYRLQCRLSLLTPTRCPVPLITNHCSHGNKLLQGWPVPEFPPQLHEPSLFVRKRNLLLLGEAARVQVSQHPAPRSALVRTKGGEKHLTETNTHTHL